MHWIVGMCVSAVALASADVCIKLSAGKLSNSLGLLIYGSCTFLAGLLWVGWEKLHGAELFAQPAGLTSAVGVGLSFAAVTAGLYFAFGGGAPISLVSPVVRLSGLLLASLVGFALFGEALTARFVLGMVLSFSGVFLIALR